MLKNTKMLKTTLIIILAIAALAWLSEIKITTHPLHISLPAWKKAIGLFLILIGIEFYCNFSYRKGWNEAIDRVVQEIDKNTKN
jgi:small neutral amino acid transporter SnatA (MarC family)